MKLLPGILGALLVVAGVAFVWWPLALIVAGGFMLVLDHRIDPTPSTPRIGRPTGSEEIR